MKRVAERAAVRELVKAARGRGEDLTGPDGLIKAITAAVLETALEEELTEHLGHAKHQQPAAEGGNIRNGTRPKTVLTDAAGEVTIAVPRDRAGTETPANWGPMVSIYSCRSSVAGVFVSAVSCGFELERGVLHG